MQDNLTEIRRLVIVMPVTPHVGADNAGQRLFGQVSYKPRKTHGLFILDSYVWLYSTDIYLCFGRGLY